MTKFNINFFIKYTCYINIMIKVITIVLLLIKICITIPKLELIIEVFRHGPRYPSFILENDYSKNIDPLMIEQLTN